ncbi:hypothetical protein B597_013220 [Stutzerimonas stutzeri KOS6]|uniref:Uncharacterized protein n=1 Tax=Stutzerimonas stutzeri KOS6 TaxID=1218352 RepID=A0A061JRM1_STUST|nr:hypothetical protein B597_013220 [Stutzerimonas stutzeri KOS6]
MRHQCFDKESQAKKKLDAREDIQPFMLPEKLVWWVV